MIDEKKIEHEAICYTTDGYGQSCNSETLELIEESFKSGADWAIQEFLKDLWHSVEEEPKLGKRVLVKINGNLSLFNSGFVVEHLRNYDDCYGIESWLYIDDLFPKKGGEQ